MGIIAIIGAPRHQIAGERVEAIFLRIANRAMNLMGDGGADTDGHVGTQLGGGDFKQGIATLSLNGV